LPVIGVAISPGATEFTVMPCGPSSPSRSTAISRQSSSRARAPVDECVQAAERVRELVDYVHRVRELHEIQPAP
jgi:hypothetical protein